METAVCIGYIAKRVGLGSWHCWLASVDPTKRGVKPPFEKPLKMERKSSMATRLDRCRPRSEPAGSASIVRSATPSARAAAGLSGESQGAGAHRRPGARYPRPCLGPPVHRSFRRPAAVLLGVDAETFYDRNRFAVVPIGFCFPGQDKQGGDLPPRPECALAWRERLMKELTAVELIVCLGLHAQRWHMGEPPGPRSMRPLPTGAKASSLSPGHAAAPSILAQQRLAQEEIRGSRPTCCRSCGGECAGSSPERACDGLPHGLCDASDLLLTFESPLFFRHPGEKPGPIDRLERISHPLTPDGWVRAFAGMTAPRRETSARFRTHQDSSNDYA